MTTNTTGLLSIRAVLIACVLSISSVRAQEAGITISEPDRSELDSATVSSAELKHETLEEQDKTRKRTFQACLELRIQANERMNQIQMTAQLAELLAQVPRDDINEILATERLQNRLSRKLSMTLNLIKDKDYVQKWRKHADAATGNPAAGVAPSIQRTIGADRINLDEQRAVMQAVTAREFEDGGEGDPKMFPSSGTHLRRFRSPLERIMDAGLKDREENPNATSPMPHA